LFRRLGADRAGAESEIPSDRHLDRVVQGGGGDVGVGVGGLVGHGGFPVVVGGGGHGVLLVLVVGGGDEGVLLGLGSGAAEVVVLVGLPERLSGDGVEFGVLVGQGLGCGRQERVFVLPRGGGRS